MVEHSAVNRGVVGSSPTRGVFRLRGQAVKTSPFHGGNTSSILVGVTKITTVKGFWHEFDSQTLRFLLVAAHKAP